jgi:hypothetical protein
VPDLDAFDLSAFLHPAQLKVTVCDTYTHYTRGDPAAVVQQVIAAAGGMIDDTPCEWDTPACSGHYSLTVGDFATDSGHLTWYGAQAFINYFFDERVGPES